MNAETIATAPVMPKDLPDLIRATNGVGTPFACIGREQYVTWIAALADLLTGADMGQIADRTTNDVAWLTYELARVVQAFDESGRHGQAINARAVKG